MRLSFCPLLAAVLLALATTGSAAAQHAGDVYVSLDGSQIVTGTVNPDQTTVPVRVFAGTLDFDGFTDDPGFDAEQVFDPDERIGFNIMDRLLYWDGSTFVETAGERMRVKYLTLEVETDMGYVPGFDLGVDANGGWHKHLKYFLLGVGENQPTLGVYLLELELYGTEPGQESSDPFWIVFNYGTDTQTHLDAVAWVEMNMLVDLCPEDINGDDQVDTDDFLEVLVAWGPCANPDDCPADANGDGDVDTDDFLAVLVAWGACPDI